jgi:hypothetical protein
MQARQKQLEFKPYQLTSIANATKMLPPKISDFLSGSAVQ